MRRNSYPRSFMATLGVAAIILFGNGDRAQLGSRGYAAEAKPAKKDSNPRTRPAEVTSTPTVTPSEAKPGETVTYQVKFKLEPGWHIYKFGKKPFGDGASPRNTTFDFFDTAGLKLSGEWKSEKAPIAKREPLFDNALIEFFEDEATWSIKLQIPEGTEPGKKSLRCQAGYQICNANSCKQPGQWTLPAVELTVLPADDKSSAAPAAAPAAPVALNEGPSTGDAPKPEPKPEEAKDKPAPPAETPAAPVVAENPAAPAPSPAPSEKPAAQASEATTAKAEMPATLPTTPPAAPAEVAKTEAPTPAEPAKSVAKVEEPMQPTPAPVPAATTATVEPPSTPTAPKAEEPKLAVAETTSKSSSEDASSSVASSAVPTATAEKAKKSAPITEVAREAEKGLIPFLLMSAGGGLLALVMPCVWPMIPITVNFFVKQGHKNKGKTTGLAVAYCLAIIGIFTSVGVLVSFFFSATALQNLANNPWLNVGVAALFLAFGLSLLGLFEVRLPNFLLNASAQGESRGGLVGVMFMATTLTITSFTCTFPVVGGLIVMAAGGQFFYPIIGLATFSLVLALPFFLLALAPGLLSKMPKSGDWMNTVKVVGGLIEIGAALKFVNTAELGFGTVPEDAWFDASVVLSAWVGLSLVCGLYLLGVFRTDHDHDEVKVGPGRLVIGSLFLALTLFLAPALFGRPPKSPLWDLLVGILPADVGDLEAAPPAVATTGSDSEGGEAKAKSSDPDTAEREQRSVHGVAWGMSLDAAKEKAKSAGKPVLIDFTGVNCVNCRKMEQTVLPRPEVVKLLSQFVTVQLYTDIVPINSIKVEDRAELAERNQNRLLDLANETTNPFYVVLDAEGKVLASKGGYVFPDRFVKFLEDALTKYASAKPEENGAVAQAPIHRD